MFPASRMERVLGVSRSPSIFAKLALASVTAESFAHLPHRRGPRLGKELARCNPVCFIPEYVVGKPIT